VRRALDAALSAVPGLAVLGACATAAVVASACGLRPDVVLLDVRLPDPGTGLDLLGALHSAAVPVVAMSASGGLRAQALAAGAAAFVEKDGAADALVDALLAAGRG
jgi:DNA-binding NarL/FixJ family response regulator